MSRTRESSALRPVAAHPAAWAPEGARLAWLLIGVGVVLRLAQYLSNRSLWMDEALLASTVVHRSFAELLDPLRYSQVAPLGFILVEKLAVEAFGRAEYALRLFPLLCGVLSLFLFTAVAKRCLRPGAVPVGLALFAVSDPLIYFASEVRQYSSDVAIALVLQWAALGLLSRSPTPARLAGLGLLGAVAVWFSHPAVFVLAGIAVTTLALLSRRHPPRSGGGRALRSPFLAFALWAVSFAVCYFLLLRGATGNEQLVRFWEVSRRAFMPLPTSPAGAAWLPRALVGFFWDPVALYVPGIVFFIAGCVSMLSGKRDRLLLLLSPLAFTLAASALRQYPFDGRLLLFLIPSVLLVTAEGADLVRSRVGRRSRAAGAALVATLFAYPVGNAIHDFAHPREHEELRPVLDYVRKHQRPGDVLYVYYGAHPAFEYYAEGHRLRGGEVVVGSKSREARGRYIEDLSRLRGRDRVWVVFSHVYTKDSLDERKFFLRYLDAVGRQLDEFRSRGAAAYLYDLDAAELAERGEAGGPYGPQAGVAATSPDVARSAGRRAAARPTGARPLDRSGGEGITEEGGREAAAGPSRTAWPRREDGS